MHHDGKKRRYLLGMTKRHQDWKLIKGFPLIFSIGVHVTGNSTPEPGMIFSESYLEQKNLLLFINFTNLHSFIVYNLFKSQSYQYKIHQDFINIFVN